MTNARDTTPRPGHVGELAWKMSAFLVAVTSFTAPSPMLAAHPLAARTTAPAMNGAFLALEAVEPAVTSYVNVRKEAADPSMRFLLAQPSRS